MKHRSPVLRQDYAEFGALAGGVGELDLAAVVGDDPVGDGEAQAGAALFGGVEGGEDAVQRLERDAASCVGDLDADGVPAVELAPGDLYRQLTPAPHGIEGVQQDVDEDLLELLPVSEEH